YHNHQMEFADLDDENAFDYLFSQADAELVKIELDIGWAVFAGVDPLAVLNRYAGRIIAVHLKDHAPPPVGDENSDPASIQAQLVEPGSGPTDFAPILAALDKTGVAHRFVEVDVSPDPISAITRGYGYLKVL
ncbi:MAG: sugar phosphate isomerase/epimerase, partial [Gammaproteobacteria bacterium]|nr:sugar phosphate isomerase/epimerase [Gammaproteobacteria bacterium]